MYIAFSVDTHGSVYVLRRKTKKEAKQDIVHNANVLEIVMSKKKAQALLDVLQAVIEGHETAGFLSEHVEVVVED